MYTFLIHPFEADSVDDALSQVLFSSAIPKNVQKISADIIENFPEHRNNQFEIYWKTSEGDSLTCYRMTPKTYLFMLQSSRLTGDLVFACIGRVDNSIAVPPVPLKGSVENKIFQYEQLIKGKYIERGALFDANGNVILYASGDEDSTFIPFIPNNAVYMTHSHPDQYGFNDDPRIRNIHFGSSFSTADFDSFLSSRNLKQERVVFSNGIVMVCEKTKPKLTRADVNRALELLSRASNDDKVYDKYLLAKKDSPRDDDGDLNRKLLKYSYELDKSTGANLGLHIYFYLKDGRLVEHLKGKKTTAPKKKQPVKKPTVKRQPIKPPVKKAPARKRVVRRSPANRFVRPENMF